MRNVWLVLLAIWLAACGGQPGELTAHSSWMLPEAKTSSALMYVGDWATNDVYVLDYSTGKKIGTLTGFRKPYGMCVDAMGDVYISNFDAGDVVEYAHGGTTILRTYTIGGKPIGCSVDASGDVAVTRFRTAEEAVFAGGDPSNARTYTGWCTSLWPMGYDESGNLVGVGAMRDGPIVACALLANGKSLIKLSACCQGPITIAYPGGTMWDGKQLALGEQEPLETPESKIWRATLSGTELIQQSQLVLKFGCKRKTAAVANPFIVGETNTPLNTNRAKVVVGPGESCSGDGLVNFWRYPQGGRPFKSFNVGAGAEVGGVAVSLSQ